MHKTRGLILRTVKYGETSVILTVYTETFGLQSYLVNGVRKTSNKGSGRANILQPGALLDLVVYHQQLRNLQRIKEFRLARVYQQLFMDVFRNSVALFIIELLTKTIRQPEPNPELFQFIEETFLFLDTASAAAVGNFPLFFSLHLAAFFGFRIQDNYSASCCFLDLQEGQFVSERPGHSYFLEEAAGKLVCQLLKLPDPESLARVALNQETRRNLLHAVLNFYGLHLADFGQMKTVPVLQTVFSE